MINWLNMILHKIWIDFHKAYLILGMLLYIYINNVYVVKYDDEI